MNTPAPVAPGISNSGIIIPNSNLIDSEDPLRNIHNIAIAYTDAQRQYYPTENDYLSDIEVEQRAKDIAEVLTRMGYEIKFYKGDEKLVPYLALDKPDLVINLVDSVRGSEILSSAVPASLDVSNIPYTGSSIVAFIITTSKYMIKETLRSYDIPTPDYELVTDFTERLPKRLQYPLLAKLNNYNGSAGLTNDAVSDEENHVREKIRSLIDTYKQPVIVDEFIEGRELSAIVLDGPEKEVYLGEKIFKAKPELRKYNFCSWDAVWIEDDSYHYEKYEDKTGRITQLSKKCFDVTSLADYAKFDIRLDKNSRPYFIDVNANPALGPVDTATSSITKLYGLSFEDVMRKIMVSALQSSGKYDFEDIIDNKY